MGVCIGKEFMAGFCGWIHVNDVKMPVREEKVPEEKMIEMKDVNTFISVEEPLDDWVIEKN
jgi:hypothetical protein